MHDADFFQGRWFSKRLYKLERDGIAVAEQSLLRSHQYHVPFESISAKPEEITASPGRWLTASICFTAIALIATPVLLIGEGKRDATDLSGIWFWGVVAAVCWIVFFLKRKSLLICAQNNGVFVICSDLPSREAVAAFIRKMFEARNKYLRARYGRFSTDEPLADRLGRLEFLRNQQVISEDEYLVLRRQQTSDSSTAQVPVGFGR